MIGTIWRDFMLTLVMAFVAMIIWLLPFIATPTTEAKSEPPGNVIIAISWPEGDTDVDLWAMGPGEIVPVGYSNKGGVLFNLLRDDLGKRPDATPLNYENAYSRGIAAGEYVVNVHCYRCPELPQRVDVEISLSDGKPGKGGMKQVATTSLELTRPGEEKTALRFKLDAEGNLAPDSMNNVFRPLRAMGAS